MWKRPGRSARQNDKTFRLSEQLPEAVPGPPIKTISKYSETHKHRHGGAPEKGEG